MATYHVSSMFVISEPFIFHLHLQIIENNGEHCLSGILRVLNAIRCYIEHTNNGSSASFHEESTDKSVYQLLDYINDIKECRISDAFVSQPVLVISVCCFTSDAVANFLRCTNDDNFRQLLFKLRRCLHVQDDIEVYDIIASCRSKDIETSKKRLCRFLFNAVIKARSHSPHGRTAAK
jgi:hypothetical protein